MPPNAPGQGQGNHALQDYQMQLMLLEQQNKKRLLMARQEQDSMSAGPHNQQGGGPGFPPAMSPQGSRAGPSPNPTDQMKRGTPKLNQQGLPGSPMPDAAMQQQRGSPAPGMSFDPSQMPPGMPPQYPGFGQMPQNPMMRPPSSHPGNFNGAQMTQQQLELMRQGGMQNGAWRGPGPQGMMGPGQPQQMGGPMNQPQQRGQMPPPPAPPAGEQPRTQEPSPSQPAQAPPTPSQANKPKPSKKGTKDNKVTLRVSLSPLSIVDIDSRSPQNRKGQIQVRQQQRQVKIRRQRRLLRLRLRRCTRTHLRTDNKPPNRLHNPLPLPRNRHLRWNSPILLLLEILPTM
jgi:hypothetical protein